MKKKEILLQPLISKCWLFHNILFKRKSVSRVATWPENQEKEMNSANRAKTSKYQEFHYAV